MFQKKISTIKTIIIFIIATAITKVSGQCFHWKIMENNKMSAFFEFSSDEAENAASIFTFDPEKRCLLLNYKTHLRIGHPKSLSSIKSVFQKMTKLYKNNYTSFLDNAIKGKFKKKPDNFTEIRTVIDGGKTLSSKQFTYPKKQQAPSEPEYFPCVCGGACARPGSCCIAISRPYNRPLPLNHSTPNTTDASTAHETTCKKSPEQKDKQLQSNKFEMIFKETSL